MTTHTEDAMTRERALEALTSLLAITGKLSSSGGENLTLRNARHELRRWGEKYNDSLDRALASVQQEPAPSADAEEGEATVLRKRFAEYLVPAYLENQCLIAQLCDEQLDRSGALLGYLREAAARAKPSEKGGADV